MGAETNWLIILAAFIIGALAGVIITWRLRKSGPKHSDDELAQLKSEFESYRDEVSDHFVKTADLVNNLTHSYRAVYEHLESGAYRLVGEETLHKQLADVEAEPVMLEYIGQRRALGKVKTEPKANEASKPEREPEPTSAGHAGERSL